MLEFREISVSDRQRVCSALKYSDFMGCEYSFANNMAWRRLADSKITFYKDFYICCAFDTEDGYPHFILPAGQGDYKDLFRELMRYTDAAGAPLILTGITDSSLKMLSDLFPDRFTYELDRDSSDYIYLTEDFISLKGKKYHGKRNHLARFKELDYTYSPITEKDFDDCIIFCTAEYNNRSGSAVHSFIAEQFAINTYFSYFNELGLKGSLIRIDGKVAAVTIGEQLNSETFCVHIEKADTSYNGIYTGISHLFAESEAAGLKYINREEDLGIEGLRRSKLSYNPAFLLNKYTLIFK
ncbi:MAG TPA: phosphatidylglycerol lysyltransferase domain-containing protein [Ruminococcus sp.]|nr:phosphatidylglycerol lysyltransferase domain-containing protein [Ruminococcus sp.]